MKKYISLLFVIIATNFYSQNIIDVYCSDDTCSHSVIDTEMLVIERWDTLPQSKFWKTVINTTKDSCIINIASSRTILATINQELWFSQTEDEKKQFKEDHGWVISAVYDAVKKTTGDAICVPRRGDPSGI